MHYKYINSSVIFLFQKEGKDKGRLCNYDSDYEPVSWAPEEAVAAYEQSREYRNIEEVNIFNMR